MADDIIGRAADLQRRGQAFALAAVVRCEAPTSAPHPRDVNTPEDYAALLHERAASG